MLQEREKAKAQAEQRKKEYEKKKAEWLREKEEQEKMMDQLFQEKLAEITLNSASQKNNTVISSARTTQRPTLFCLLLHSMPGQTQDMLVFMTQL